MKEKMLSRPDFGWSYISLGGYKNRLSYLTNLPIEWLNAAIYGLENLTPFAVHGFCEPGRLLCLVSYWNCHVIFEDERSKSIAKDELMTDIANVSMLDFCIMLRDDISDDLDAWCNWDDCNNEKTIKEMKVKLAELLDRLSELIIKQAEHFGENRCFF